MLLKKKGCYCLENDCKTFSLAEGLSWQTSDRWSDEELEQLEEGNGGCSVYVSPHEADDELKKLVEDYIAEIEKKPIFNTKSLQIIKIRSIAATITVYFIPLCDIDEDDAIREIEESLSDTLFIHLINFWEFQVSFFDDDSDITTESRIYEITKDNYNYHYFESYVDKE